MADALAPTFNKPKPKNVLLIGGIAAGGGLGYLWYRRNRANASSASNQPTSTGAIDPNTGVPYADEQSYAGVGVTPGALGTYNPLTGQYIPGSGSTIPTASVPASHAEWATAAQQDLLGNNFDPNSTATALGLYLAGQPLTQDQYQTVQAALAFAGPVPPPSVPSPSLISGGGMGNSGNGSTGSGQTSSAPQPGPVSVVPWSSIGISNPAGSMTLQQLLNSLQSAGYSLNNLTVGGQTVNVPDAGSRVNTAYLPQRVISATPYSNKFVNVSI